MSCTHSRNPIMVEVRQCEICGRVEQRRVRAGTAVSPVTLIRRGLLTAGILIDSLQLTGADAEYLLSIIPCVHPPDKQRTTTCAAGNTRIVCDDCGLTRSKETVDR